MEPETPWRYKAKTLHEKSLHGLDLAKIKKALDDFEKNVNLEKLIIECKTESDSKNKNTSSTSKPKPKPSGLLGDFNDYFSTNLDWSQINEPHNTLEITCTETETTSDSNETASGPKSNQDSSGTLLKKCENVSKKESLLNQNEIYEDSMTKTFSSQTQNCEYEFDESRDLLKSMFPDVEEEVIVDLLMIYENDIDTVTNVLLDSVNFNEHKSAPTANVQSVESLKNLCINALEKLEIELEKHYENASTILDDSNNSNHSGELNTYTPGVDLRNETPSKSNSSPGSKSEEEKKRRKITNNIIKQDTKWDTYKKSLKSKKSQKKNVNNEATSFKHEESFGNGEEDDYDTDDSVLSLNLAKTFLNSLVQLFGEEGDEMLVNGN